MEQRLLGDVVCATVGAFACVVVASVVMSGWHAGLIPNLSYPYVYAGDALYQYYETERAIEGWVFDNPRSGFPFGSPSFDRPGSDAGNQLVSKLLGEVLGSYFAAANAYFLLGFGVTFAVSFWVMRRLGLQQSTACVGAALFTFTPYHFARLMYGHTYYTWYFVVPLYVYLGFKVFGITKTPKLFDCMKAGGALSLASCFGVYFAFFGVITIMICGFAGSVKFKSRWPLVAAIACSVAISFGVAANVAPSVWYTITHGKNLEASQRSPVETEVYALKLMHLIMPSQDHQVPALARFSQRYATEFPLSNTNGAIGLVGVIGLVLLGLAFIRQSVGQKIDPRTGLLVLLTGATMMIATVGGLNVLFALFVSPLIRGWDRISIFFAFYAVLAVMLAVDRRRGATGLLACLLVVGFLDQTPQIGLYDARTSRDIFEQDHDYYGRMEASLPSGSAVYQLPYLPILETGPLHNLGVYDHLTGFLNSKALRWNTGGTKGREADLFYRELATKPLAEQIRELRRLGFAGISIDRRGYADGGAAMIADLTKLIGAPTIVQESGSKLFFDLRL